jgi:hypothetical protein
MLIVLSIHTMPDLGMLLYFKIKLIPSKHLTSNWIFIIETCSIIDFYRLFDGENVTNDEHHMWLCPFNRKDRVRIIITLSVSKKLHGLRVWNYNKSPDDTYRGVRMFLYFFTKEISVRIDKTSSCPIKW